MAEKIRYFNGIEILKDKTRETIHMVGTPGEVALIDSLLYQHYTCHNGLKFWVQIRNVISVDSKDD